MPRIIAFIPVRGGSSSIPLKNIRMIGGRPLLCWALDAAVGCPEIQTVYVCTDTDEIGRVAAAYGSAKVVVVGRSPEVSTNEASTESVMLEFARDREFDHMVLIQATSPLLSADELGQGLEAFFRSGADSACSVSAFKKFRWGRNQDGTSRPLNYDPQQRPRRQEFSGEMAENGAFYITSRERLLASACRLSGAVYCHVLPERHLFELDEEEDWPIVECLLRIHRGAAVDE